METMKNLNALMGEVNRARADQRIIQERLEKASGALDRAMAAYHIALLRENSPTFTPTAKVEGDELVVDWDMDFRSRNHESK